MTTYRCLTVRPPWAQPIIDGHKDTENRSKGFPKSPGLTIIHAAAQPSQHGLIDPKIIDIYGDGRFIHNRGQVLGVVNVAGTHMAEGDCCAPWGEQTYPYVNGEPAREVLHLELEHPVALDRPIEARGALGYWRPDPDLLLEVCLRLAEQITWDRTTASDLAHECRLDVLHNALAS